MNIYGLHRFSIENSLKLAISHLFCHLTPFFHTFSEFFFRSAQLLIHTNLLKKIKSVPITVLKFCLGTRFVTSYARTHARTDELLDYNTSSRPKGPRAKI